MNGMETTEKSGQGQAGLDITVFSKDSGLLTKRITLNDDGSLSIDGSACKMSRGSVRTEKFDGLQGLADLICSLKQNEALALANTPRQPGRVVAKDLLVAGMNAVARSNQEFRYAQAPGVALLDADRPKDGTRAPDLDEVMPKVLPAWDGLGMVVTASTSAFVYSTDGECLRGAGSEHRLLIVQDASDWPRACADLGIKLWAAGHGRIELSRSGAMLERTVIDLSVTGPERLVFEAAPEMGPRLESRRPAPCIRAGAVLDTSTIVATEEERARADAAKRKAKEAMQSRSAQARSEYVEAEAAKLAEARGIDLEEARITVLTRARGDLLSDDVLVTERGTFTVADVLSRIAEFDGVACADPAEGGRVGRAMIFANAGNEKPLVRSFAHGGANYFMHDGISYEMARGADPEDEAGRALISLYAKQARRMFNERYGMLTVEDKTVVVSRVVKDGVRHMFQKPSELAAYWANVRVPVLVEKDGEHTVKWTKSVYEDWRDSYYRRTYSMPFFRPEPRLVASAKMPPCDPVKRDTAYPLYIGASYAPQKGDCDLILNHIREVWCGGEGPLFEYTIKWLARMVQQPHEVGGTVLALRSGQGAGKNIVIECLTRYFGAHAVTCTKPEDLVGFNDHLGTAVMVFLNEATWGGSKAMEGPIKALITDPTLFVERKFMPKFSIANCTHLVIATNNDWAVPVGMDDRRFVMMDLKPVDPEVHAEYFAALDASIKQGADRAFVYFLLNEVDLEGFNHRKLPQQKNASTKLDHKLRTADPITKWWIEVLTEGGFTIPREEQRIYGGPVIAPKLMEWDDPMEISRADLYAAYEYEVKRTRGWPDHQTVVGKKLRELLGGKLIDARLGYTERTRVYRLPTLEEARTIMETVHLKQAGPWADHS